MRIDDGVSSITGDARCIDRTSGSRALLLLEAMLAFRRRRPTFRDILWDFQNLSQFRGLCSTSLPGVSIELSSELSVFVMDSKFQGPSRRRHCRGDKVTRNSIRINTRNIPYLMSAFF